MRKNAVWAGVCGLMTLSLVAAACGSAPIEEKPATTPAPVEEEPAVVARQAPKQDAPVRKEESTPESVKPQYGGTLYLALASDITTYAAIETC